MGKKVKYIYTLLSYVLTVCLIVGLFPATSFAKSSTQVTEATKPTKKIVETTEATKPQKQKTMQVTDVETQKTEIVDIEEEPEKENLPAMQITPTTEATTINNLIENSEQNDTTQNAENCDGKHTDWIKLANKSDTDNANIIIVSNTLKDNKYFLDSDVTITETLQIEGNVVLCLNGKSLTLSDEAPSLSSVIQVNKGAKLTLCDCQNNEGTITGGTRSGVYTNQNSKFIMNGGKITGNSALNNNEFGVDKDVYGGGIFIDINSDFIMNGGEITSNSAHIGGGVFVNDNFITSGTFTMNGGSIAENTSERTGGGVTVGIYLNSTNNKFIMNGGSITKNKAGSGGGGVDIVSGSFIMNGGSITENISSHTGAGVYISGGTSIIKNSTISKNESGGASGGVSIVGATLTIENSNICDNIATSYGGGIYISSSRTYSTGSKLTIKNSIIKDNKANFGGGIYVFSFPELSSELIMESGTISSNKANFGGGIHGTKDSIFTIKGNTIVAENKKTNENFNDNVYLLEDVIINVAGALAQNAKIGVTVEDPPTEEKPSRKVAQGKEYTIPADDKAKFTSDNDEYKIVFHNDDSAIYLEKRPDDEKIVTFIIDDKTFKIQTVTAGETVSAPTPDPEEGYTLDGWYQNENCTGDKWNFDTDTVTDNMTLYAKWIQNEYTVTFDSKNGLNVSEQTVKHGDKVEEPNPVPQKDGSTFGGWYEDENCTQEYNFNEPVTKSFTLYAKWNTTLPEEVKEFTITFDSKGGSTVANQTIKENEKVIKPANPTKTDFTFSGWFTDEACTQEYNFDTPVTEDMTLYAKWNDENTPSEDVKEFTVTFNTNSDSTISSQKVQPNAKAIKPTDPAKSGYTFKGWFTNTSYTQKYDFDTAVTADITLFAKWEENKTTPSTPSNPTLPTTKYYTVTFESNGGSAISSQTISSGKTATIPQNPTKNDYEFLGWFADKEFNKVYQFSSPVISNITLYAKWKSNDCIVTFDSNGGSDVPSQTIETGKTADMPKSPTKSGYSFLGWFADENFNEVYRFSTPVTEDITIYAKWKSKSHSSGGGGGSSSSGRTGTWVTEEPKTTQTTIQPSTQYQAVKQDCPRDETCPLWKFNDVDRWAWYHDGSHYCVEKDLIIGTTNTTFSPHMPITRAMVVAILWRIEDKPLVNDVITFKDVNENEYYAEAVRWAAHNGIVSGYSSTVFAPNDSITREQMASILYRYTQYKNKDVSGRADISNYQDRNEISNYALTAIQWACNTGIINGISTTILSPKGTTTRAQAAQMFKAYLEEQF